VAVLHGGRLVALDTPGGLAATYGGPARITFSGDGLDLDWLERVPGVARVERRGALVEVAGGERRYLCSPQASSSAASSPPARSTIC
jgi:hypothetical protein